MVDGVGRWRVPGGTQLVAGLGCVLDGPVELTTEGRREAEEPSVRDQHPRGVHCPCPTLPGGAHPVSLPVCL